MSFSGQVAPIRLWHRGLGTEAWAPRPGAPRLGMLRHETWQPLTRLAMRREVGFLPPPAGGRERWMDASSAPSSCSAGVLVVERTGKGHEVVPSSRAG